MKQRLRSTSTSLAFAIAVFAVTASSAYAFSNQAFLTKAGLSDDQVIALQEARELRKMGDIDLAGDILMDAGIDLEVITELREIYAQERALARHSLADQMEEKLTSEEQDALQVARSANDKEAVRAILKDAGVTVPWRGHRD